MALIALFFLAYNCVNMLRRGPYPTHPDEGFIVNSAWQIVKSGDPNPHFFNYGSLPIYLTSLSLGAGVQVAKLRGEIATLADAEPIAFPYYRQPHISYVPRYLFAAIGALALLAVGLYAAALAPNLASVVSATLVLALYPLFQQQAWTYLNTDIVVTALASSALAYLARSYEAAGNRQRIVIPALFCGAALASKYNAGLLLLPFVIATLLASPMHRALLQLVLLGGATLLVFLVLEPFALLDFDTALSHALREMHHYREGHPNHEGEPGWPMLQFYAHQIRKWLGYSATGLLWLGALHGLVKDRKRTLILLSFPLTSIAFMCMQRVNFTRNLLPAVACLIPFVGLALVPLHASAERASSWLGRRAPRLAFADSKRKRAAWGVLAGLFSAILFTFPKARTRGGLAKVPRDSRKEVSDWLIEQAAREPCHVLLPTWAGLRGEDLRDHCTVELFELHEGESAESVAQALAAKAGAGARYIALPRWKDEASELNGLPYLLGLGEPLFDSGYLGVSFTPRRTVGDPRIKVYAMRPLAAQRE